ncbi:hypothetical protein BDV93DRAFT_525411 [Ceratobasidium sp. AG-I]|nr:hypothetical protein BDV93DRAFT_525411 [Ceratobasidium sp. AG-I]
MTGVLAQKGQLDTLIRLTSQWKWGNEGKLDATKILVVRAANVLQEEMNSERRFTGLTFWGRKSSITIDGQSKQEGYFTPERCWLLLSLLWEQRDIMLSTFAQSPVPGFATVLLVISANALKNPQLTQSDVRLSIYHSVDLLARYSLVAVQDECSVVQGQCISNGQSHLVSICRKDHRAMADLLARRLSPSDQQPISLFFARHSGFMLYQFTAAVKVNGAYELVTPVMQAGFEFFWREFLLPEKDASPWRDITTYGPGPVVMLKELVVAAEISRNLRPLVPAALKVLYDVDFIDWCGRLALMPMRRWANATLNSARTDKELSSEQEAASQMLLLFSDLANRLSACSALLRPIDQKSYEDWVRVFDFAGQLLYTFKPGGPLHTYVNQFVSVWVELGTAFGYLTKLQEHRQRNWCLYGGCSGHSVCGVEQLVCGDCLSALYCSSWCQRADWVRHSRTHTKP